MRRGRFREVSLASALPSRQAMRVSRHARLPGFIGLKQDPHAALDGLRLGIVGVGSVGLPVALHASRLQIGALYLVDRGRYKPESLLTQPVFPEAVGEAKASHAGRLCKQISPNTRVCVFDGAIEELDFPELWELDVMVLATDNLLAEVETGQRCVHLRQPLVHASVHGETLVAQVRTFGNRDGSGPCPACGFGAAEWGHLNRETRFSCEGWESGTTKREIETRPTQSVSFLCQLASDLAMMQVQRIVLGLGKPVEDKLLEYCGYSHRLLESPLRRNPDCPCEHAGFVSTTVARKLADCTIRDLLGMVPTDFQAASLELGNLAFAERAACPCGRSELLNRFVFPRQPAGACGACGGTLVGQDFYTHRQAPMSVLETVLDRPLAAIGAGSALYALLRDGERAALLR